MSGSAPPWVLARSDRPRSWRHFQRALDSDTPPPRISRPSHDAERNGPGCEGCRDCAPPTLVATPRRPPISPVAALAMLDSWGAIAFKRGMFRSIVELQAAINRFLEEDNHDPKPFTWTADPDRIIAAVRRGRKVLDAIH